MAGCLWGTSRSNEWVRPLCDGLPDLHGAIAAGGDDELSIGGPGHSIDFSAVTFIGKGFGLSGHIPDLHGLIGAAGGDATAIRRPGHPSDDIGMTMTWKCELASICVPDMHSRVRATGGDEPAIGRPGEPGDASGMPTGKDSGFSCRIPDLHVCVIASRSDTRAIR